MQAGTNLERQIRSQPEELTRLLTSEKVQEQVHTAAQSLQRSRRIWLVGTGTSYHAAILGAGMLQDAGRAAVAVSSMRFVVWAPIVGPDDTIIVITHTGETAYALAARALAMTRRPRRHHDHQARDPVPPFGRDMPGRDLRDLHRELHDGAARARHDREGDGGRLDHG